MTLQQLEYILALDKHRHFVKAAKSCYVTQPTITLQVQKLENEIGIQIFDRSKSPLVPTATGQIILAKARLILQEVSQLKEMVSDEVESLKGEFTVGVIPTVSPYVIPHFARGFIENYPETKLDISEMRSSAIIDALSKGTIDVGILVTPLNETFIREIPLYNEPFVFYGNSKLKMKAKIEAKDLQGLEDLWLLKSGHCFRNQLLNLCGQDQDERTVQFQSGSIETLKKMVQTYGGYTLIPELAVTKNDKVSHFKNPKPIREVSLVVHQNFPKEGLIDALKDEILKVIPKTLERTKQFYRIAWR